MLELVINGQMMAEIALIASSTIAMMKSLLVSLFIHKFNQVLTHFWAIETGKESQEKQDDADSDDDIFSLST